MLARATRLNRTRDIELVHKKGRVTANKYFRLKYRRTSLAQSRATVVVSQKVSRSAVKRNRLKRQIRPILAKQLGQLKKTYDILVIVQSQAQSLSSKEINNQLSSLLEKIT